MEKSSCHVSWTLDVFKNSIKRLFCVCVCLLCEFFGGGLVWFVFVDVGFLSMVLFCLRGVYCGCLFGGGVQSLT